MACVWLRLILLVCLTRAPVPAAAAVTPDHLFPLAQTSITYDAATSSLQPSALNRPCPRLALTSKFKYASFYYDGSPTSLANFTLTAPPITIIPQFSFAFWIQPDSLEGVFFEYRNDVTSANTIKYVKGELVGGAVKMSFGDVNGVLAFMTSSKTMAKGAWMQIVMTASNADNKMTVLIGSDVSEKSLNGIGVRFAYPGTWRIGESWDGDSFFLGKLNCAALYLTALTTANLGDLEKSCTQQSPIVVGTTTAWKPPATGVPNCTAFDPDQYQQPVHLWPLTGQSLAYDVTTLTPSQHPGNSSTCPDLDEDSNFSTGPSWRLDGSRNQRLELRVSEEVYSFSVAVYIWTYTADAVLLEYLAAADAAASSASDITQIVVRLSSEYLQVQFHDNANVTLCNVTSANRYSLRAWKWMALDWNYGLGSLTLTVDSHRTEHPLPTLKRRRLATPGLMKVGGTDRDLWLTRWPQPFLGKVICLAVFGHTLDSFKNKYEDSCLPTAWPNTPSVPTCPVTRADQYYPPIHLWPLTNVTLAYDVIAKQDAVTPTLSAPTDCPIFRPSDFYPAMAFENNPPDVILRIPSATPYVSFTFGMYAMAAAFQGLLIEYVMDADAMVSGDVINHLTLEILSDKKLRVNMTIQDGTPAAQLISSHHLDNNFKPVLLAWDLVLGIQLSIDSHLDISPAGLFRRVALGGPGRLKVAGKNPAGGAERYRGLLSCVAFFSRAIDKDVRNDFKDRCLAVVLPNPPLFDPSACTNQPATPVYSWPLTNVTMATEALSGMPPVSSASPASCHRLEESGSTLSGPHQRQLYFDGSLSSSLELPVNESLFHGGFSLVLYLKPEPPHEGQVLEYTATPITTTTSTRISRIQVSFGASSVLEVSVWSVNQSSASAAPVVCSHWLVSDVVHDAWSLLRIGTSSEGKMQMAVNDSVWTGNVCTSPVPSPDPNLGRLTLGGRRADGSSGYRGALGCLMLFSVAMTTSGNAQLLEQCQQNTGTATAENVTCNQVTPMRNKGFRLVGRNVQPSAIVRPPIKSLVTPTNIACASECMQTPLCRSYVIKSSMTSKYDCWMYDYVSKVALMITTGSKYYEIKQ